jgi:NAD(P)H-flavin reductase
MERLIVLKPSDASSLEYSPGQFFMVGLPGWGEAPISVTSPTGQKSSFELCVRAAGNLTNAIHRLKKGDTLWVRGPFGRGFDLDSMKGRDILFVAGGIGIVPMRSLVKSVLGSKDFGNLTLVYGAKNPEDLIFMDEIGEWRNSGVDVRITVDSAESGWKGHVGVVTTLIPDLAIRAGNTVAAVIGPPVMYKYVIMMLEKKLLGPDDILVSLERRMKCGLGKCGHCQINSVYVCQEGPVFKLSELAGMPEAF